MATGEGERMAREIRDNIERMSRLCSGIDEETASRGPAGRWSPKEIISHICGPEDRGMMPAVRAILDKDTPLLDMEPENPFFTGRRKTMKLAELIALMRTEYGMIAELSSGLSEEQLGRKARIPMFKETPLGEYPTLGAFISAMGEWHFDFHITHMKEVLQALGAAPAE
jgi:hypothetical protein